MAETATTPENVSRCFRVPVWRVTMEKNAPRTGKVKYALLGWLIGLPLPIIIILLFARGCDF
jgi:hypothetical protein